MPETDVIPPRQDVAENEAGQIRVRCIRCDSLVSAENVSLRHGMAKCPNCEILFTLEHDLKRHPVPPLTRLKLDRTTERLEIRQKRRWLLALSLFGILAFLYGMIAFALFMSWWAYDQGHEFDQLRGTIYLSTAVSLFAGLPIFLYAYRCLFLTKRLAIDAGAVRFRWHLFPFFGGWSAPAAEFSDVFYDSQTPFRRGVNFQCGSKQCRLSVHGIYEEHLWIIPEIRRFLADLPQPPVQRLAGQERNEPIVDGFCPKCRHRYGVPEYDFVAGMVRCGECATETPLDELFFLEDRSRFELDFMEPEPTDEERRIEPAYRIEEDGTSLTLCLEPNKKAFWPLLGLHLFLVTFFGGGLIALAVMGIYEGKPGVLVPLMPLFSRFTGWAE